MSRSTISTFQLFELYPNEESARVYLEGRLWPSGPVCPACQSSEHISALGTCATLIDVALQVLRAGVVMIEAIENGTEYERPPARLIARWRMA